MSSRVALFHDHGGQFYVVGRPAADALGGLPLPRLAGPPSRHHLPLAADAVLHLVRSEYHLLKLHSGTADLYKASEEQP